MRDLLQVLRDEDSLHWKAVAHAWGVDLGAAGRDPLSHLVQAMLDPDRVRLQFRTLSAHAQEALARLRQSGGRMPLMRFGRDYGEIREMGLARREREQPWLAPKPCGTPVGWARVLPFRAEDRKSSSSSQATCWP